LTGAMGVLAACVSLATVSGNLVNPGRSPSTTPARTPAVLDPVTTLRPSHIAVLARQVCATGSTTTRIFQPESGAGSKRLNVERCHTTSLPQ